MQERFRRQIKNDKDKEVVPHEFALWGLRIPGVGLGREDKEEEEEEVLFKHGRNIS